MRHAFVAGIAGVPTAHANRLQREISIDRMPVNQRFVDCRFVKAFGQDCDTLIAAGQGARFKAYLNIQPAPGKRNPYRNVSQVQLLEKVVQF